MNKKINELWVKALRSGEFHQGKNALVFKDRYCVLGVLATLAMVNGASDIEERKEVAYFNDKTGTLAPEIVEWAELKSDNGTIKGEFLTLQGLNDICDYDFLQLADIIEKNCEVL